MTKADSVHSTPPLNSSSIQDANPLPEAHGESVDSFSQPPAIGQPESGNLASESGKPPRGLSRRAALAGLAMLPAAVPAVAATSTPTMPINDSRAIASVKRTEEIIDLLRTRYIRKGWKMDEEAAERALAYCQKYAADGSDPDDEREAAMDFFRSHGQSLDWVFDGDHQALICRLASFSERARAIADAELLAMADRYVVAFRKWGDLATLADEMDHGAKAKPMPVTLRWRDEDAALGLPDITDSKLGRELAWDCEAFVGKLRLPMWLSCTQTGDEDDQTLHLRRATPSAEARGRADEIIAAFDKWKKERAPRGFKKAEREANKAFKEFARILDTVEATPAQTVEGMVAKVRCAQAWAAKGKKMKSLDAGAETMALSILDDLERQAVAS